MEIVAINPFRCRLWALHDRIEEHVNEETCRQEIESFLASGQRVPALGRALRGDPSYDVELIYGARRLFVARHVNKPLLVELRDISDREAIIAMDIENRQRTDVSPYERGLSYRRWVHAGYFASQDEVARELRISASQVSRLLKIARLPAVIVNAFRSPLDIREEWGLALLDALENEHSRRAIIHRARAIALGSPRLSSRDAFRELLAASPHGRKLRSKPHDEIIRDGEGNPLFRVRHHRSALAILLPIGKISVTSMKIICGAIADALQGAYNSDISSEGKEAPADDRGAVSWASTGGGPE